MLDVYKRQTMIIPIIGLTVGAVLQNLLSSVWKSVSYTHLDVYKRQGSDGAFLQSI